MCKFTLCVKSAEKGSRRIQGSGEGVRTHAADVWSDDHRGKTPTVLTSCEYTHTHTLHVWIVCAAAGASGADLDRWRGAISGQGSMHHSLVTTDLQQSFYFNYSRRSRQRGGRNLCSNISKVYSSSASLRRGVRAGKKKKKRRRRVIIDYTVPTSSFDY